jgi:hypothetical protein
MPRIYTKTDPAERFWKKVNKNTPSGCWEWTGAKSSGGYGSLGVDGKTVRAHRFSYELHFEKIADGLEVLHKCDNCKCVRPDHLFVGTQLDNVKDMRAKGRARYGETKGAKNGRAKLTEKDVRIIRRLGTKMGAKKISKILGFAETTIHDIIRRLTWKHID